MIDGHADLNGEESSNNLHGFLSCIRTTRTKKGTHYGNHKTCPSATRCDV